MSYSVEPLRQRVLQSLYPSKLQSLFMKHIKLSLRLCASAFILLILAISLTGQSTLQKVETYLEGYHDSVPMPGFSVVIVKEDQVLLQKGYGVERMGEQKTMTDQSVTGIGQLTMSMTAMAILQLSLIHI